MGYRDGKGVEKNIDKAVEILSEICQGERFDGCAKLGEIYQDDAYGKKDEAKAYEYYLLAFTKKEHEASGKYRQRRKSLRSKYRARMRVRGLCVLPRKAVR
ncbi:sel1 repeat family protein [Campylobacter showae]|uniref:sel1 repeat family protein n=1 Tax=Campylobacter showae TaxID=204 RepID=UPI000F09A3B1|nr:sel1 repeat family protein [Campylobacter showae]